MNPSLYGPIARQAFTVDTEVLPTGKIEASVPLLPGTRVQLIVLAEEDDDCCDLLNAAASSMDFWDNPDDDLEWNNNRPHSGGTRFENDERTTQ